MKRTTTILIALFAVGGLMVALTLSDASLGPRSRRSPGSHPAKEASSHQSSRRLPSPVSAAGLALAQWAAARFLDSYLQLVYGHAAAVPASEVTRALRRQLADAHAQITPVEGRRHTHFISLQVVGMTPGFVLATAMVRDGGVTPYRLRVTLQGEARGWAVSGVGEG